MTEQETKFRHSYYLWCEEVEDVLNGEDGADVFEEYVEGVKEWQYLLETMTGVELDFVTPKGRTSLLFQYKGHDVIRITFRKRYWLKGEPEISLYNISIQRPNRICSHSSWDLKADIQAIENGIESRRLQKERNGK